MLVCLYFASGSLFHTGHTRGRSRLERDRDYEDYVERDSHSQSHGSTVPSHLAGGQDYREHTLDRNLERISSRDHRGVSEDDFPPHRTSSRRAVNVI